MLTFRFTGASGEMIETEMLTAGMESKEVRLEFSSEWDGLRRAVVFVAGSKSCTVVDAEETEVIPAQMLSESMQRLYVGAYGLSEEGMVVIPAIYATGPFIHIGTDTSGDGSDYVPEDPFWLEMEDALNTTVRFTPQALSEAEQLQARQNIGALGHDPDMAELLTEILRKGVYTTDQYEPLLRLKVMLCGGALYPVTSMLTYVTTDNTYAQVYEGDAYQATLTPQEGYKLNTVTVTMGGQDVTASVYSGNAVNIPKVTGAVLITAKAVADDILHIDRIVKGNIAYSASLGMQIYTTTPLRATIDPVGQYLKAGKRYRFSLRAYNTVYSYNVLILKASAAGLSFPYVDNTNTSYKTVTARVTDNGWLQSALTYPVQQENLIVAVNFKRLDGGELGSTDYANLKTAFLMEELA